MKALCALVQNHIAPLQAFLTLTKPDVPKGPAQGSPIRRRMPAALPADAAETMLHITCPDPTQEDRLRDRHMNTGQRLVRQERWTELSALIHAADNAREMTPGAMPVADLMAYGARGDVVMAAEHALLYGRPALDAPLLSGIEALEHVLAENEGDYTIAVIVAQAHMDIGWAWRGTGWDVEVPRRNREAFEAHFDRAHDIINDFSFKDLQSPMLASSGCALLGGLKAEHRNVADRYETLIALNPANPRPMRTMGSHLLPRWYGTYDKLELEARRTAANVINVWGAGGYTWVMFDAIAYDDQACANLDLDFFIEGLRDILDRHADPYTVNLLAAFCANAMGQTFSGQDQADQNRALIGDCARWIVRDYMTELHPMIWAHAAQGFDNSLRVKSAERFAASGREDAMRIITTLFSREIAAGKRVVFTETGPEALAI